MTKPMQTTGSLVWHLALRWRNEVDQAIAHLGITHAQYLALASLHAMIEASTSPTQRELADATGLQAIYISKLIRSLEADGYLTRTQDKADSRALRLDLTDRGRTTIIEARRLVRDLDERLTAPLGGRDGAETEALAQMLRSLINHADFGDQG